MFPRLPGSEAPEDPSFGKPGSSHHDLPALPGSGSDEAEEVLEDWRFEAELPNDIWQSDAKARAQGPRGGKEKTYLFAFIDDMSRLVCHGGFFLNEKVETSRGRL